MAKHINTFQGGLDLDTNVNSYDNTHYPYALDMRLISDTSGESGTLTNMEDSKVIVNVESRYTIVGLGSLRENTIIFTRANSPGKTGRIFSIANSTLLGGTIITLNASSAVVSKAFDFGEDVQIIGRYETPSVQKIYWADSNTDNSIRFANLADPDINSKDVREFNIVQEVKLASPALKAIINGTLKTGVYQYSYCLFNDNGAETGYSSATPPIPISSSSLTDTNSGNFTGSNLGETTSKGISITITGVDTNFSKIRVARLFYSTQEGTPEVEIIYEGDTASTLTISDGGGVTLGSLILEDVRYIPNIFSAKTLEVKNDFLFAGNIVEDTFDIDFDARAYRFRNDDGDIKCTVWNSIAPAPNYVWWEWGHINIDTSTWDVPENYNCVNPYNILDSPDRPDLNFKFKSDGTLGGEGKNIEYQFGVVDARPIDDAPASSTPLKTFTTGYDDLSNPITIQNQLGYQRGEIYRFGIVFYDKYGRQSYVKWIGDIRMVDDSDGGYYGIVNSNGMINDLPIRFKLKSDAVGYLRPQGIVGWQIVRAERTYADATVKDCGYLSGLQNVDKGDGVKFRNRIEVSAASATNAPNIFEYISPETVYNKNNNVSYDRVDLKKTFGGQTWMPAGLIPKVSPHENKVASPVIHRVIPNFDDSTIYKIRTSKCMEFKAAKKKGNTNLGVLGVTRELTNSLNPFTKSTMDNRCVHGTCLLLKLDSVPNDSGLGYYARRRSYGLPYGGYSYDAIKSTVYYPCSPVFAVDTNIRTVWGGDCYIGIFEYMRGLCSTDSSIVGTKTPTTKLCNQVLYALVETKINLMYTVNPRWSRLDSGIRVSGGESGRELFTGSNTYNAMWETAGVHQAGTPWAEDGGTTEFYEQDYDLYVSNPVYNIMDKSKVFFIKPPDLDENNSVDTRIYRTGKKFNGEVSDTWTKFPINNQLDVDTKYGGITKLVNFKDKLFYFQPKGIGVIAVQEREVISGQSGASTVLGVGGVMDRYDYITTDSGCNNINAIASSTSGLYYADEYNKKLCRLGQNVEFLSDIKGIRSWADEKDFTTTSVLYNQNFNELWFYIGDETIIFNEYINAFVSFTGERFNKYSKIGNKTFITTPTNTGKRLDEEGTRKNSTLHIYSNPNNLIVNRFDSLTFGLTSTGVFDTIKFSNRYQYSNSLDFSNNSRLRFRNYIINNLRDNTGKRLYDNHLKTELVFNTSTNETIKVFDIITNYTPINAR